MRHIIGNIIKANKIFKMIQNNDRIAIAISGGKDSLALALALSLYKKKLKNKLNWEIKIKAFYVDIGFGKMNLIGLKKILKKNQIELKVIKSNIAEILKATTHKGKIPCSFCSRMRKSILIQEIKKENFNKLAIGHHIDDAIETLFMNILNEGRIETFQPMTYLSTSKVWVIKPLILCHEKKIISFAKKQKFPLITNPCPNAFSSQRTIMKNFIHKNFYHNKIWPNAFKTVYLSVVNLMIKNIFKKIN